MTPIQRLVSFSGENEIFMKRDDLLPFSFGGNKVRIAQRFFRDALERGCDAMVGYGSSSSNLSRVIANGAAALGMPCWIVSSEDGEARRETANSRMMHTLGVHVRACDKAHVAQTVAAILGECRESGYRPYYIYGDEQGVGNEAVPTAAYADAYNEIADWEAEAGTRFDFIFLASGTGMTQAGLICGDLLAGGRHRIIGISVARDATKGCDHIQRNVRAYLESIGSGEPDEGFRVEFEDSYRCGGYNISSPYIDSCVRDLFLHEGIPADTTYVGKGFAGMLDYLEENEICDARVLFIHTGGTPLFFDTALGADV